MLKEVRVGKTRFHELYQIFDYANHEEFQTKKAKLFPSGNTDTEVATTSIFLASLSAVKEYREELFSEIGINKIKTRNVQLHVYTELNNPKSDDRIDGLIVITSGKHTPIIEWIGFVETKVKDNSIAIEQIDKYSDFARGIGINSIITISNYLVTTPFDSPIKLKKRSFELYHWSWTYLKVTASRLIRTNSIEDEDHIYILSELRRYFDSHKNLNNFENMGVNWKDNISKIHALVPGQKIDNEVLNNIVDSYKQEEKDISLQLTDQSQHIVTLVSKNNRIEVLEKMLNTCKVVTSQYIIDNDKKYTFFIDVDFMKLSIKCYTYVEITKGKAQAQTSALIRMLESESGYTEGILIDAVYPRKKTLNGDTPLFQLISEKEHGEPYSILNKEFGEEVKYFEVKTYDSLGLKKFQSVKNFIVELEIIAARFLNQVMENIK